MGDIVDTSFIVQNLHHLNMQLECRPQYCQGYGCRNRQRDPEYEAVEERAGSVGEQESGEDEELANSLILVRELLVHKGKGSLYATLMDRNYISEIEFDDNTMTKTAFRLLTLELTLTETGKLAFREIIAIIFEYLNKAKDEWLADG